MKTISDALKSDSQLRLEHPSRKWLVWDDEWVVYHRPRHARNTVELYRGLDESEAIKILCKII